MSYQGIYIDRDGKIFIRFREKGQIISKGPYDNYASALAEHMGCGVVDRHRPSDVKSTKSHHSGTTSKE